jgi:hypothetical protein
MAVLPHRLLAGRLAELRCQPEKGQAAFRERNFAPGRTVDADDRDSPDERFAACVRERGERQLRVAA